MNAPPSIALALMAWKLAQVRTRLYSMLTPRYRGCICPLCYEHHKILDRLSAGEKP